MTVFIPIDWREELGQIERGLRGEGGMARIHYSGEACAPSAFLETLKAIFETRADQWKRRSLQIDHNVYSVRYLAGVRDEFVRKIGFALPEPASAPSGSASLHVVDRVEAGGDFDAEVSNVTQINHFPLHEPAIIQGRSRWLDDLVRSMADFLETGRFMIVMNAGPREAQDEFWRHAWHGRLDTLVAKGLWLVQMIDTSAGEKLHELLPDASPEIYLPSTLSQEAQRHATDDVTQRLVQEIGDIDPALARIRADTLVRANRGDIPRLHRQSAALIVTLGLEGG
ncbi:MAG TPA: hypothetical protein VE891_02040 [Allosphingosinicella sp.]|nr:hypothetical protein [Allosphingosinicella sp.]